MIAPRFQLPPIGVDIGARYVKVVQLASHAGKPRIQTSAVYRRACEGDITDDTVRELQQVLRRQNFRGQRIVMAAPRAQVRSALLDLPAKAAIDPLQVSRMEMSRVHRLDADSFECVAWPVEIRPSDAASSRKVMAYMYPHHEADALLDLFAAHSIEVARLDLESCALLRACRHKLDSLDTFNMIVSLGWNGCQLAALTGTTVAYERSFSDFTLAAVRDEIASVVGVDPDTAEHLMSHDTADATRASAVSSSMSKVYKRYFDRLCHEIGTCVQYVTGQPPSSDSGQLLLVGGGAELRGADTHLEASLEMPVQRVAPLYEQDVALQGNDACSRPSMTLAFGLACNPVA